MAPLEVVLRKLASVLLLTINLASAALFSVVYKPDWRPQVKQAVN